MCCNYLASSTQYTYENGLDCQHNKYLLAIKLARHVLIAAVVVKTASYRKAAINDSQQFEI